jgi:hypothetical protein
VPGAGDQALEDAPLPERTVLVLAHVRDRGHARPLAEDRYALASYRRDARPAVGNLLHRAQIDHASGPWDQLAVGSPLSPSNDQMEPNDQQQPRQEEPGP